MNCNQLNHHLFGQVGGDWFNIELLYGLYPYIQLYSPVLSNHYVLLYGDCFLECHGDFILVYMVWDTVLKD